MASLREMRRRTASVRSISKITKAMKMVAAARLRRAQDAILSARPYAQRIEDVLADIAARHDVSDSRLLKPSGGPKTLVMVITADKGLCGSFNANVIRRVNHMMQNEPGDYQLIAVGKKGRDYYTKRGHVLRRSLVDLQNNMKFETAISLRDEVVDPFLQGEANRVFMVYNEFKSAMTQNLVCRQLLPVEPKIVEAKAARVDFEYEPNAQEVFSALIPHYFAVEIWRALLESFSAEMGARMTSMEAATKNATEMINRLTLVSNRLRQAIITNEITEIVAGADALK